MPEKKTPAPPTTAARGTVWTTLERRWPQVTVAEVDVLEPRSEFTVQHIVQHMFRHHHRGIEPIRIIVPAQIGADADPEWDEPMPVLV